MIVNCRVLCLGADNMDEAHVWWNGTGRGLQQVTQVRGGGCRLRKVEQTSVTGGRGDPERKQGAASPRRGLWHPVDDPASGIWSVWCHGRRSAWQESQGDWQRLVRPGGGAFEGREQVEEARCHPQCVEVGTLPWGMGTGLQGACWEIRGRSKLKHTSPLSQARKWEQQCRRDSAGL